MATDIITSHFSTKIPDFIYGMDEDEIEYIVSTKPPCLLIKIHDINISGDEDEEEELAFPGQIIEKEEIKTSFHLEGLIFTNSGMKPLGVEKNLKAIQEIIKAAVFFYLALEDES